MNIDSTIKLSEIDKDSETWKKLKEILTEYEEFGWLGCDWCIHNGDLEIDHTFILEGDLIVTGDLIIKGDYVDGCSSSSLIVLGDMIAENIISEAPIYVKGNVTATGLILCYCNDNVGEFYGKVTARLFCIDDRDFRVSSEVVGIFRGGAMCPFGYEEALTTKDVAPFIDEVLYREEYEECIEINFNDQLIREYLEQGKSIYK